MSEGPDFDPEAVIDAVGLLLGLAIADEYRAGIAANLRICAGFATLVLGAPLNEHEEIAPVFTA